MHTFREKLIQISVVTAGVFMMLPATALAAPQNFAQLVTLIIGIINPFVGFLTTVALIVFFWGIVKYIYSAGGEGKDEGRSMIVWGVVSIFVIVAVFGLAQILVNFIKGT